MNDININLDMDDTLLKERQELEEEIKDALLDLGVVENDWDEIANIFDLGMQYSQNLSSSGLAQGRPDFFQEFDVDHYINTQAEIADVRIQKYLTEIFHFAVGKELELQNKWHIIPQLLWNPPQSHNLLKDFSPSIASATGLETHAFGFDRFGNFSWNLSFTLGADYLMDEGLLEGEIVSLDLRVTIPNPTNEASLDLSSSNWPSISDKDWWLTYEFDLFEPDPSELPAVANLIEQFWVAARLRF